MIKVGPEYYGAYTCSTTGGTGLYIVYSDSRGNTIERVHTCAKCGGKIRIKLDAHGRQKGKCQKCKRTFSESMIKNRVAPQLNDYDLRRIQAGR